MGCLAYWFIICIAVFGMLFATTFFPIDVVYQYSSSIGSILAALFTGLSAFLLWVTLSAQRKQNEKQAIENHFYKMLEIARENSNNIRSKGKTGRSVFANINKEFSEIYLAIDQITGLNKLEKIQVCWLILFYGLDSSMFSTMYEEIKELLKGESNKLSSIFNDKKEFVSSGLKELSKKHNETQNNNKCYHPKNRQYLNYDGYQSILAHYYRHLYQIVTYINRRDILSYDDKYHYIKTLRAQLNVFELALLFYNTLSPYGKTWEHGSFKTKFTEELTVNRYEEILSQFLQDEITEITEIKENDPNDLEYQNELIEKAKKNFDINNQLITKYQFFRNATIPLLSGKIKISDFYPMINYENATDKKGGITKQKRKKLDAIYRKQDK